MDSFDLRAPLAKGVTVLEASAGTGKTYTIAGLATRHVADGLPLDQLLVVTFTRLATGELRERVRERFATAERGLTEFLRSGRLPPNDDLVAFLSEQDAELRRHRLAHAVATFDSATITTTHGFCMEALGSLGFTGNVERDCAFVEDVSDLMDDVVNDLFVRRFIAERPRFARAEAMAVARAAIEHPTALLVPEDTSGQSDAAMRVRLAKAARAEMERRKRVGSLMTFDDVLTRLAGALDGPGGEQVAARLRNRYRVVLVDEFQDTDPVQWQIMRRAFDHPDGTLILIGDPKQAIYAFRGADVYAYLDAARSGVRGTLGMNWRSDQRLLTAYDLLFGNAKLGHDEIEYRATAATPEHRETRLHGPPVDAPLRIRVLDRRTVRTTPSGYASAQPAREAIAIDAARDIAALLQAEATITRGTPGAEGRIVKPGDIAVLVRRNQDAALIQGELGRVGVPAVIAGAGSVFGTDSARDWLALLEALERPSSVGRVHAAALTPFIGWSASEVASADDPAWESVHDRLHTWAQVLRDDGVAALLQAVTVESGLPRRVLSLEQGERVLTDLRHIGQLLHAEAMDDGLGAAALTQWLRRRILEAKKEGDEERARRLESDDDAVQVLTIHRSKGLEYPIVYCPFLWDPSWIPDEALPVFFHDEAGARTLDVGLSGAEYREHQAIERAEERGEDLRLAYVALTRARHQAVIWWAGSWDSRSSPLSRLVFARAEDGTIPAEGPREVPSDDEARAQFAALGGDGCISVESAPERGRAVAWAPPAEPDRELAAARFDRGIDRTWRRTSYSDITAPAHESFGSEPEVDEVSDERTTVVTVATGADEALREIPSPLADLPGGVRVGTLVHDVFEAVDFAADDLVGAMGVAVREAQAWRRVEIGDPDVLASALARVVETPLLDGIALRDVGTRDRLDELGFELPLAGAASPRTIGALLRSSLPVDDPLHAYADRLEDPLLRPVLRGYLTGSIDLTFRVGGRYAIVDYKTNRLGDFDAPLTLWDYRPDVLAEEMRRTHYALQGLLYTVALHRYLRWRVPGYSPDRDIAGVFYLFVRGMAGPDGPSAGVFSWKPPGELVVALSDLLDEGVASS
ncbi:MAG: UvrD-helicase domain-containing protein [Solirubrobacteraceae bacterium]|nr:UvrD-helicase domain-containing protein [Solirubrobacteraceae bacterium]